MLGAPQDHFVPDKGCSVQPGNDILVPSGFPSRQASQTPQATLAGRRNTEPASVPALQIILDNKGVSTGMGNHSDAAAATLAAQELERLLNAPRELWKFLKSCPRQVPEGLHNFATDRAVHVSAAASVVRAEPLISAGPTDQLHSDEHYIGRSQAPGSLHEQVSLASNDKQTKSCHQSPSALHPNTLTLQFSGRLLDLPAPCLGSYFFRGDLLLCTCRITLEADGELINKHHIPSPASMLLSAMEATVCSW